MYRKYRKEYLILEQYFPSINIQSNKNYAIRYMETFYKNREREMI
jgi:hypothetical protein